MLRTLYLISGAIEKLIMMDTSYDMVKLCRDAEQDMPNKSIETSFVVGDEEFLPIKERYFNANHDFTLRRIAES